MATDITANKGVEADVIGSEAARPTRIEIGVDLKTKKKIDELKEYISGKRKTEDKMQEEIERLQPAMEEFSRQINEMERASSTAREQIMALAERFTQLKNAAEQSVLVKIRNTVKHLKTTMRDLNGKLNQARAQRQPVEEKINVLLGRYSSRR